MNLETIATERDRELTLWVHVSPEFIYSAHFTPDGVRHGNMVIHEPVHEYRSLVFAGALTDGSEAGAITVRIREILRENLEAPLEETGRLISEAVWAAYGGKAALKGVLADFCGRGGKCRVLNANMPDVLHFRRGGEGVEFEFTRALGEPFGAREGMAFGAEDVKTLTLGDNETVTLATPEIFELTEHDETKVAEHQEEIKELCRQIFDSPRSDYVHLAELPFRIINELVEEDNRGTAKRAVICAFVKTRPTGRRFYSTAPLTREGVDGLSAEMGDFVAGTTGLEDLKVRTDLLLSEFLTNICKYENRRFGNETARLTVALGLAEKHLRVWVWHCAERAKAVASESVEAAETQLERCNEEMADSGRGLAIIRKLSEYISVKKFANMSRYCFHVPYWHESGGGNNQQPIF